MAFHLGLPCCQSMHLGVTIILMVNPYKHDALLWDIDTQCKPSPDQGLHCLLTEVSF